MAKLSKEDKQKFDELYQYIKKDIFEYGNQKLPKYMILRLIGLKEGKFMANNKVKSMAKYDYSDILYTFKINKMKIKQIVKSQDFKNEQHRFNTIMIIVEREINDVVKRLKQVAKSDDKVKNMPLDNMQHEGADYKSKSKGKILDDLEELW